MMDFACALSAVRIPLKGQGNLLIPMTVGNRGIAEYLVSKRRELSREEKSILLWYLQHHTLDGALSLQKPAAVVGSSLLG